jgi:rubredoxin
MADQKKSRYESPCEQYIYDPEAGNYEHNIPPGTPLKTYPKTGVALNAAPKKNTLKSWTTEQQPSERR